MFLLGFLVARRPASMWQHKVIREIPFFHISSSISRMRGHAYGDAFFYKKGAFPVRVRKATKHINQTLGNNIVSCTLTRTRNE